MQPTTATQTRHSFIAAEPDILAVSHASLGFVNGNPCRICGKSGFKNSRTRRQHERHVHELRRTATDSTAVCVLFAVGLYSTVATIAISFANAVFPLLDGLVPTIAHAMSAIGTNVIATGTTRSLPAVAWTFWFGAATFRLPQSIPEGTRNYTLTRYAGALRRRGAEEDDIVRDLLDVNQRLCKPPLPERDVRGIARSVSRYPLGPREGYRLWKAAVLAATPGAVRQLTAALFIVRGRRGGVFEVDLDAGGGPTCSCGRSMTSVGSRCGHTRAVRLWVASRYPLEVGLRF